MIKKQVYIDEIENEIGKKIDKRLNIEKISKRRANSIARAKFGKTLRQCSKTEVKTLHNFLNLTIKEEEIPTKTFEQLYEEGKTRGPIDRKAVMAKSNNCCDECNNPLSKERDGETHIDHKRPKAFFGSDDIDNLRALCVSCHNARRDNPNYRHKMKLMQGLRTAAGMTGNGNDFGLFAAAELVWNMHSDTFYDKHDVMMHLDDLVDNAEMFMNSSPECRNCGFFESYCECNTFTARKPYNLDNWRIQ